MTTHPTIHVTNTSSSRLHGLGRRWSALRSPGPHLVPHLDGPVRLALAGVDHQLMYQEGRLQPGSLMGKGWSAWDKPRAVQRGDSLLCTCPRLNSPRWTRSCHLELLAHWLVRAGWLVVLHGRELQLTGEVVTWADCGRLYRPGVWPAAESTSKPEQVGLFRRSS
jgi:hypothetical protein